MASVVNPLRFESILKQQGPGPLYLIVGEEDLLRDQALAALKSAVLGNGVDFNYDLFYGDEVGAGDIRNCTAETPVFADRRLVVVKAAEKLPSAEGERLLDYLKDPVKSTTLAFISPKLDGRLRFAQVLARTAVTVDCTAPRDMQLDSWVTSEAERIGVRLEEEAGPLLKEASGGSLYGVRRELEKLASYVPSDRAVTAADVLAVRGMEPGASVFDLSVAIAEGNRGRALSILARNLEAGEAPLRILGSLAWQYRRLWKVKELLASGGREGEAARTLRMEPMKVRLFAARFSVEHLQRALQLFLDVDGYLKGGGGGQPKMALERLLLRLCEYTASPAPAPSRRSSGQVRRVPPRIVPNVRTIRKENWTKH